MYEKKQSRKAIALILLLALVIGCAAGGTIAWLVAIPDPLVNTFAPRSIDLSLSEPSWKTNHTNENGEPVYKTIPGDKIPKDPTVTIGANSANCYVRLFVVIWWESEADSRFTASDSNAWFKNKPHTGYPGYWHANDCIELYDTTNNHVLGIVREYRYSAEIKTSETGQSLQPLFDYIEVPKDLGRDDFVTLDNFKLMFFAQAVQSDGFADANAAFAAAGIPEDMKLEACDNKTLGEIIYTLENQKTIYPPENS